MFLVFFFFVHHALMPFEHIIFCMFFASLVQAGGPLLAATSREGMVRVWHIEQEYNYVLMLNDPRHMSQPKDVVVTVAFNPRRRLLVPGFT
jgi:hypothetical protein